MKIVVFAGGVGAAKFLEGLVLVTNPADITVIVNTGDDEDFYGLRVCPDIDTIIYTLSKNHNEKQGWGLKNESFTVSHQLEILGNESWFTLGDKDIATHIHRTNLLRQKKSLSAVTDDIARHFGISFQMIPMSDDIVRTMIKTPVGLLSFQEYFVKRRYSDKVIAVTYSGIKKAAPAPGVLDAIDSADALIIAPSNPIVSINTILAIPKIKEHIKKSNAKKIAISPIVGGKAIKGPAEIMLKGLGIEPSAYGVAKYYSELIQTFVIDNQDEKLKVKIEKLGISVMITNTIMKDTLSKKKLASKIISNI